MPRRGETRPSRRRLPSDTIIPKSRRAVFFGPTLRYLQSTAPPPQIFLITHLSVHQVVRLGLHQLVMSDDVSGGTGARMHTHTRTHTYSSSILRSTTHNPRPFSAPPPPPFIAYRKLVRPALQRDRWSEPEAKNWCLAPIWPHLLTQRAEFLFLTALLLLHLTIRHGLEAEGGGVAPPHSRMNCSLLGRCGFLGVAES